MPWAMFSFCYTEFGIQLYIKVKNSARGETDFPRSIGQGYRQMPGLLGRRRRRCHTTGAAAPRPAGPWVSGVCLLPPRLVIASELTLGATAHGGRGGTGAGRGHAGEASVQWLGGLALSRVGEKVRRGRRAQREGAGGTAWRSTSATSLDWSAQAAAIQAWLT